MASHRFDRRTPWYGDESPFQSPACGDDAELVGHLSAVLGREAELDAVLAVRSTVQPATLSEDEVEAFFAPGYLVVEQMSSPEELAVLRMIYDTLFEVRAGRAEGLYTDVMAAEHPAGAVVFPKIHQIYRFAPELVATRRDQGLELDDRSVLRSVVPCPLRAGGATLHESYLLHHTAPNRTAAPRWALIAIFGLPPEWRSEPLHLPWQSSSQPGEPGE